MKVWLVSISGHDSSEIRYACLSYETAVRRWDQIRNELIELAKEMMARNCESDWSKDIEMLKKIKPTDRNYDIFESPNIEEMETEE